MLHMVVRVSNAAEMMESIYRCFTTLSMIIRMSGGVVKSQTIHIMTWSFVVVFICIPPIQITRKLLISVKIVTIF